MGSRAGMLLICLGIWNSAFAENIAQPSGGGKVSILETRDYYRSVLRKQGNLIDTVRLHGRFFRYCEPRAQLPLLVTFVQWGGTLDRSESVSAYENPSIDPWIGLVLMPEMPSGNPLNTSTWYWGNAWMDSAGALWSEPWVHNAVVSLLEDLKSTDLIDSIFPGVTLDSNRFYATGTSVGGTAVQQLGFRHPEIFAAFHAHAGWTSFRGSGNHYFSDERGCLAMANVIGGTDMGHFCIEDPEVHVRGFAEYPHLSTDGKKYPAAEYTDLSWYFGAEDSVWNFREPSFATPYAFVTTGSKDNPAYQGDQLYGVMQSTRRGMTYRRVNAGHEADGVYIRWDWMRRFKRNQSYLAFTDAQPDTIQKFIGIKHDLSRRGWDPESIVDEPKRYSVQLTGEGQSDITLRRLQQLEHIPGTTYALWIDGEARGRLTADKFGLVTVTHVQDDALVELRVIQDTPQPAVGLRILRSQERTLFPGMGWWFMKEDGQRVDALGRSTLQD